MPKGSEKLEMKILPQVPADLLTMGRLAGTSELVPPISHVGRFSFQVFLNP